jgi:hypothetical protein
VVAAESDTAVSDHFPDFALPELYVHTDEFDAHEPAYTPMSPDGFIAGTYAIPSLLPSKNGRLFERTVGESFATSMREEMLRASSSPAGALEEGGSRM